jgi:hypothetical protein
MLTDASRSPLVRLALSAGFFAGMLVLFARVCLGC